MGSSTDYRSHTGVGQGKHHKATLFRSDRILVGLNCLEPGQVQPVHVHDRQDKFYVVQEGRGAFTVGGETIEGGPGTVVWAPAPVPHGVANPGPDRLVLLVGIAPAPPA